jgi:saccharopine dehydrogenase (NAD+, L-lysine-forming)
MKVLIVGCGGVGESSAILAKYRDPKGELFETMVMADYDLARAQKVAQRLGDPKRFPAEQVDGRDIDAVVALIKKHDCDVLCTFTDVTLNMTMLQAALKAGVHHMDASTSPSFPHPTDPTRCGVKLTDDEFAIGPEFEKIGKLALAGFGIEPGMSDWFARFAADHLFDEIDEINVRDGANLEIPGFKGITFGFSVWMTIEECTNPAVVWERERGFYPVPALSEPEMFFMPEGIGWVECAHVEHEEVLAIGHAAHLLKGVKKADFKYALGDEFIAAMEVFNSLNIQRAEKIRVGDVMVAPRDVIQAAAPDPQEIGKKYVGKTCGGTWVKGRKDGMAREVYLYQVADNQECMEKFGVQVVTIQTAFTGVAALELLATGKLQSYKGNPEGGVRVAEEFIADDYVKLMPAYGFPGGILEMDAEYKRARDHAALIAPVL